MTTRLLNVLAIAISLAMLFGVMRESGLTTHRISELHLRISTLERQIEILKSSTQRTSRHISELTAALPSHRWTLQPGILGMDVQVPIYVTRHNPRP